MKKTKKKKKSLYGKRQKFGSFFLKVFVPFILVASLLGGIVTYLLVSMYKTNLNNNVETVEESVNDKVDASVSEHEKALAGAYIDSVNYDFETADNKFIEELAYASGVWSSAMYDSVSKFDGTCGVYEENADGELTKLVGQESLMFVTVKDKNGKAYRLFCSYDDYMNMTKDAHVYFTSVGLPEISGVDEIYVKDNKFWLSKYRYLDYVGDVTVDEDEGSVEYDSVMMHRVTVTDIPDGYEKLDESKGYEIISNSLIGLVVNNVDFCQDSEKISSLVSEIKDCGYGSTETYSRRCDYGKHFTDVIKSDEGYYIVVDYHYNFIKSVTGKIVITTWIGIVLLSTLISLAIAYVLYRSYKSAYDMEQYRRTTSNAMAHDLKSPLAVISLYAENLKAGSNPEKNQYYMDGILEEVRQMNAQVASILNMAKAEDVDAKLNKVDVNVGNIVNTVAEIYAEKIAEKGVKIDISGSCTVNADEALMYQAVVNVMDNAVKYVQDGGHITVKLSDNEASFVNSSEPLDDDTLANVWKPFAKGDNSRHGHNGTGLGLSIVRTIMDRHGFDCEMVNCDEGVEVRLIFR